MIITLILYKKRGCPKSKESLFFAFFNPNLADMSSQRQPGFEIRAQTAHRQSEKMRKGKIKTNWS